jgi:hypothetical protein
VPVDDDRNGVLVVHVWLEGGTDQFRARLITSGPDGGRLDGTGITVAVTASPEGVPQAVRSWLTSFLGTATGS